MEERSVKRFKRFGSIVITLAMLLSFFSGIDALAVSSGNKGAEQLINSGQSAVTSSGTFQMSDGWKIQSSALVTQPDSVVGSGGADVNGWYPASVPNTVLGALIDAGDPTYPDAVLNHLYEDANFALPYRSRFAVPWWYRNEFTLPASENGKKVILNLEKINYNAEIYINGTKVENQNVSVPEAMLQNRPPEVASAADPVSPSEPGMAKIADTYATFSKDFMGAFRTYELDVTSLVTCDGTTKNTIAIKVTQPTYSSDLTVYWVDWHMQPPDNNMGILGKVFVNTTGNVRVRNPYVTTKVNDALDEADLTLYADVSNTAGSAVGGTLIATVKDPAGAVVATAEKAVTVNAKAFNQEVSFTPAEFAQLKLSNPSLWWAQRLRRATDVLG